VTTSFFSANRTFALDRLELVLMAAPRPYGPLPETRAPRSDQIAALSPADVGKVIR